MCHSSFTQGSHDVDVDNAFRNNTVYVEPFMSRYMSVQKTTWQLFVCFSAKFYRFIRFEQISYLVQNLLTNRLQRYHLSMNKEYK